MDLPRPLIRRIRLATLLFALTAWFARPGAAPVRADWDPCTDDTSYSLCLGVIKKGDSLAKNATRTYTVSVPSQKQILVLALDVDAVQSSSESRKPPKVQVNCPTNSGSQVRTPSNGQNRDGNAVFCTPRSQDGSNVTVTITLTGDSSTPVNYAVVALRRDQQVITDSFASMNRSGMSLEPRATQLFFLPNTNSNLRERTLVFTPSSSYRAAAALYRQDGDMRCGTFKAGSCDIYDSDYTDYYLVIANLGDTTFTYSVRFTS